MQLMTNAFSKINRKYETFLYGDAIHNLESLEPKIPEFYLGTSCAGSKTIFDDIARRFCNNHSLVDSSSILSTSWFFNHILDSIDFEVSIPIGLIESINASKSNIWNYKSLYEFGRFNYHIFKEQYQEYDDIALFSRCFKESIGRGENSFSTKAWYNNLKWHNHDGSHRFSVAYYLAGTRNIDCNVTGKLSIYFFNGKNINELLKHYDIYIMEVGEFDCLHMLKAFQLNDNKCYCHSLNNIDNKIYSNMYSSDENAIEFLVLNKKTAYPAFATKWLNQQLRDKKIISFKDYYESEKNKSTDIYDYYSKYRA